MKTRQSNTLGVALRGFFFRLFAETARDEFPYYPQLS
jgi:hypothetical protein